MTAAPTPESSHPARGLVGVLGSTLDEAARVPVWSMGAGETAAALEELCAAEAQLAALKLKLLAHAEAVDVTGESARVSMAAWLRDRVRIAPAEAKRQVKLARALEHHEPTAAALAAGELPVASAAVIVKAVDALPAEVERSLVLESPPTVLGPVRTRSLRSLVCRHRSTFVRAGGRQCSRCSPWRSALCCQPRRPSDALPV